MGGTNTELALSSSLVRETGGGLHCGTMGTTQGHSSGGRCWGTEAAGQPQAPASWPAGRLLGRIQKWEERSVILISTEDKDGQQSLIFNSDERANLADTASNASPLVLG